MTLAVLYLVFIIEISFSFAQAVPVVNTPLGSILGIASSFTQNGPIVNTPLGSISGIVKSSWRGLQYYSFRGIRYAEAPTSDLRFKPPVAVKPWRGVFDATQEGPACYQPVELVQSLGASIAISEDCLRINVYTHSITGKGNLRPVLVYIHGGGFYQLSGQSQFFGPDYLTDHDIVVVTLNYRLGSLGFFSTGDKYAPGNYGMKDQVQALRWVRDNIRHFGGDPSRVTIAGESAGGVSVSLHMISPMSRGLFHGAIAMSGSSANSWAANKNPLPLAQRQANLLNCSTENTQSMVACIKGLTADQITSIYTDLGEWRTEPLITLSPVIERETDDSEPFLTKDPIKALVEGDFAQVPVYTGITKDEFYPQATLILQQDNAADELSQNWTQLAPIALMFEPNDEVSQKLREFYFGSTERPITKDSFDELGQLYSDSCIIFGVVRFTKLMADKSTKPVYLYRYSYPDKYKPVYWPESVRNTPGVVHGDGLIYTFYSPALAPMMKLNTEDGRVVERSTTLIKNFVETGNPTPEASEISNNVIWTPFTTSNPSYLEITGSLNMVPGLFYQDRMSLWESLYPINQ